MLRTLAFLAAVAVAAPLSAATYAGKPMTPATETRFVGRDIVWKLAGGAYLGSTDYGRPVVLCQSLAKQTGRLASFTVDGRAISDSELAKCNAAAREAPQPALAQAE